MRDDVSALEKARLGYEPRTPDILRAPAPALRIEESDPPAVAGDADTVRRDFPRTFGQPMLAFTDGAGGRPGRPHRVGVVLSGGQAPGGHNVILGLHEGLVDAHADSRLFGFRNGPRGILKGDATELTREGLAPYRNTGGFDLIGSGRDKIESAAQIEAAAAACASLRLDGLVVIGGDDSNTNAAVLAEAFAARGLSTAVAGVPKTIDGDLKNEHVEASFGFDTATKVYAEMIGNICRDALSARKYWHFVKLMGRSASHVTLECALATRPNVALIGEEVRATGATLESVVESVADVVRRRSEAGKDFGVCLVPEGLVEFVPEMRRLIDELNGRLARSAGRLAAAGGFEAQQAIVADGLSTEGRRVFETLPAGIRNQLLLDRDSHGNVQVSKIETEKLVIEQVRARLERLAGADRYAGKFSPQGHFLGYEGRCAAPSNFDADYTYALGRTAALLVHFGRSGYLCCIRGLAGDVLGWRPTAVPIASLLHLEERKGKPTPVIAKALVDLEGAPFRTFAAARARWALEDGYRYPGAIQYFGPSDVRDRPTETLRLERGG